MIETTRRCCSLFILIILTTVVRIQPSLHGHNNAFVQDDSDVQYLLDSLPISMHKGFSNSVHENGNAMPEEDVRDSISYIEFEPNILDFKERQLGVPHQETVTLFNRDDNRTIHLSSISGNTQHFHASFFHDKVIPPLGNTTFNVVFLGREEGKIDSHLFIHTSEGTLKYQVKGTSISSPYRLQPVIGVKLPMNASFTPLIHMHNPHSEPMQVVEVYSSGREFQLELPSGEVEGPRELWEIPPFQTKPVIRLHFNAYTEKNHTAYIRFKLNNSAEVLIVAVEIEVSSGAGLHWGDSSGIVNFGMGGSHQSPIRYQIALKNSAKKSVKVQNIVSTPTSKALKINFEPIVIPGDTDTPLTVGTLIYDWKTGLDLKHFKGKLMIKGIGPGGSSQKLAIPWIAKVLQGGLEVNTSAAHYCSPHSNHPRNFSVTNKFKLPLAITNVSLPLEAAPLFRISNFVPKVLKPGQGDNIFTLSLKSEKKHENLQLESLILIHSNVSITEVPLLSYNGKLNKIIPGGRVSDKDTMNFGTVSSGTENEGIFALENLNPVNVELHGWGVNMPKGVLELMGCQNGPADLFNKGVRNITACSVTGNQSIKPGYLAIFKIKVKTPFVEEDTIVGDVFVKTTYERLIVPVHMKVARGEISMKKLTFTDCFPGSICLQQVRVHSTFSKDMEVTSVTSVNKDERIKYIPLVNNSNPIISRGDNHIGSILLNPLINCKEQCYLGLSLNSSVGSQWLNTLSLPSHTRDSDLNLLNTRFTRFLNITSGGTWDNISMQLDTSEVRGYKFSVNIKPCWPSILVGFKNEKDKNVLSFPLTQVGNNSYKNVELHNPTMYPLLVHLVMDWSYPQGMRLFHSLPNKFKPTCLDCPNTVYGEFKLDNFLVEKEIFEKEWGIGSAPNSFALVLEPNQTKTVRLSYTPSAAASSSALLYIRNNITILEVLRLVGRGAHAQFKFGNLNPGSKSPLLFELTEKHLKDCETERNRQNPLPNLTVKRSFTARNTGELPIEAYSFFINGLACEGYGFKVLNCAPFTLQPNATKKIEIAFTPDFTLSRIERNLFIKTSLGLTSNDDIDHNKGLVKLNLVTTVPPHTLEACATLIARPNWESPLQWTAIGFTIILLICVLAAAFLEADRILRGALVNMSRGNPTQPPLDLRLLSHSSPTQQNSFQSNNNNLHHQQQNHNHSSREKLISVGDELIRTSNKTSKKDDSLPDWNLMNVKRNKEKDSHKGLKIPDWSAEEERKFRMDAESKDTPSLKRCVVDSLNFESTTNPISGTKKRGKRSHNIHESGVDTFINSTDMQVMDKKNSPLAKSSPLSNKKGKSSYKEDSSKQFPDQEVQSETIKRKQSGNGGSNNGGTSNHSSYKKYDTNTSQKITHYSEEETSSTTTESSVQEDNTYKECENSCDKVEKSQTKSVVEKNKSQIIASVPSLDFKDNYEGDCDDDDYEKEKQNNPNRWKTSTTRSGSKHHPSKLNAESISKIPRQKPNPQRKEKALLKRRNAEKIQSKAPLNGIIFHKDDTKSLPSNVPPSIPPPPSVHWGENRAKFSDVVARSQDNMSPFSSNSNTKLHKTSSHAVPESYSADIIESMKRKPIQDFISSEYKFKFPAVPNDKDKTSINSDILGIKSNHSNSYFVNTFKEPPFEPELIPYDDLPETDEPLVELENTDDNAHGKYWSGHGSVMSENPAFKIDPSKPVEKILNLSNTLKENWLAPETSFHSFYARGAVGEERSGVWGINTGGVWSPWGAPTPPIQSTTQTTSNAPLREPNFQERSDFDPFRSFNTIWTPTSDAWTSKQKE